MLFNSFSFIFFFLPVTLLGFFVIGRRAPRMAAAWLSAASVFFYGWWNPVYVLLLMASIGCNFLFGARLAQLHADNHRRQGKQLLTVAVSANLLLLGWYKYTDFFLANLNQVAGTSLPLADIVLPLGISFFTGSSRLSVGQFEVQCG